MEKINLLELLQNYDIVYDKDYHSVNSKFMIMDKNGDILGIGNTITNAIDDLIRRKYEK